MLISNHVLAGALIGGRANDPVTALAAGVVSHVAMDSLPHWSCADEDYVAVARADGIIGLGLIAVILPATPRGRRLRVAAGILGACLPDTEQITLHFWGRRFHPQWFARLHSAVQREHAWQWQEALLATGLSIAWLRQRAHLVRESGILQS